MPAPLPLRPIAAVLPAALAAAALAAAARPAAAQAAARSAPARAAVRAAPPAEPLRPLARYRFAPVRDAGLPAAVTVADSAGALVGRYWLTGDVDARPLDVTVLGTDLVLQGAAPEGLLTLVLEGQNAGEVRALDGRWSLGARSGTLRGRVTAR